MMTILDTYISTIWITIVLYGRMCVCSTCAHECTNSCRFIDGNSLLVLACTMHNLMCTKTLARPHHPKQLSWLRASYADATSSQFNLPGTQRIPNV